MKLRLLTRRPTPKESPDSVVIRELRTTLGLDVETCARLVGIAPAEWTAWERKERVLPAPSLWSYVAEALCRERDRRAAAAG